MTQNDQNEQELQILGRSVRSNLQTLELLEQFLGATVFRLGILRWPNFDWDSDNADGDLIITFQQETATTHLLIEAATGTPGGVRVEEVPQDSDKLQFHNLSEARAQYDSEQQEDENGNVAGSRPQTIDLAAFPEFSEYLGSALEKVSLVCTRRSGWVLLPLGILLDFSGGLQLYATIGEDTTEVYRRLTRKYDKDALVMMSISKGTM